MGENEKKLNKNYEDDFILDDVVDLEVDGYEKGDFRYQPTTAGDENKWLNLYTFRDENGKLQENLSKINEMKLSKVVKVPYSKETLKKITGLDKDFQDYTANEKWNVFAKMKASVFNRLITEINRVDKGESIPKKN